jgi:EAL and modified HD-GYP domain-containing signal transduction protein
MSAVETADEDLERDRMPTEAAPTSSSEAAAPKWAGEVRYVARQPILNLKGRVHAYELLSRDTPEEEVNRGDGDMATRTILDNAVIFGLERFTNGLPAFVNCTVEALTEDLVNVLTPAIAVLVIPASLEPTPAIVDACRALKDQGFRIALDDFTTSSPMMPLVKMAEYIRIDFTRLDTVERQHLRKMNRASLAMVAKKVDTQEHYQQACAEGFTLFQGDYFCHPVLLKKRKVPTNRLFHIDIVRQLHHHPIDIRQISKLVMRDASLTFRLLQLVNSPLCAIQQEVRSIESAIVMIGEDTFRRIVSLAVLSELSADQPPEILQMALVRARFCELAAELGALDAAEQYLLGMLSLLPAMLCLPMDELIPSLPLRDRICEALLGTMNPERTMLAWLEAHEHGNWEACDAIVREIGSGSDLSSHESMNRKRINQAQLIHFYAESVIWAQSALRSAV